MDGEKFVISPDTQRNERVPPGQRLTMNLPVLQYGGVHKIDISKWTFKITGLVERDRILSFDQFNALPKTSLIADVHCVTGWSMLETRWEGVSSSVLKSLATILPEARYALVHGAGNFTTNLSLDEFFADDVVFALGYEGKPITPEHGYPVRLVVPRLYFWKSAKWVTGVEFMDEDRRGFWESHGYHNHGDPWTEERYG
jgi:DMSO/TMAO reductase YedYZ molybdopterin-dependent catalytic subunit